MTSLQNIVADLAAGCDALTQAALAGVPPTLTARLDAHTRPYVAIRMPLTAAVYAETDTDESIKLAETTGADLSAQFDAAVAKFLTYELEQNGFHLLNSLGTDRSATDVEKVPILYAGTERHPVVDETDVCVLKFDN